MTGVGVGGTVVSVVVMDADSDSSEVAAVSFVVELQEESNIDPARAKTIAFLFMLTSFGICLMIILNYLS